MKPTQLAIEEANKIRKNIPKFQPYGSISNISDIGNICSMYGRIHNGHRKKAKSYFDKLPTWSRSQLPSWVIDYFITDQDFMSYDHWKMFGRQVKLGERSTKRDNAGTALFQKTQTRPIGEKFVETTKKKDFIGKVIEKVKYRIEEQVNDIDDIDPCYNEWGYLEQD
jgi:hypothetical protein